VKQFDAEFQVLRVRINHVLKQIRKI